MEALAPIIKSVVAAIIPFIVTTAIALAARYDIVLDADAATVFISGVITAVLTGIGVYASPANKPPSQ